LPLDTSLSTCPLAHLSPCSVHPWPPPPREASSPPPRGRVAQHNSAGYVHSAACGSDQARTPSLRARACAPSRTGAPLGTTPPQGCTRVLQHEERPTLDSGRTCSVLLSREKSKGPTRDRHQLAKGDRESGSTWGIIASILQPKTPSRKYEPL